MRRLAQTVLLGTAFIILAVFFVFYASIESGECLGCQMISDERIEEIAQTRKKAKTDELGSLCINGVEVPYDARTGKWYIAQSFGEVDYTGKLSFSDSDVMLAISDHMNEVSKEQAICDGTAFKFIAYTREAFILGELVFTGLPVLAIYTEEIGEEFVYGDIHVFEPETEEAPYYSTAEYKMGYHIRGNSSRNYEKKGYRLNLLNEKKEEINASLLGMRKDGDWILNALYSDPNRVREKLCIDLWNETSKLPGTRMEYAELFINDSYEGIYGLLEPIDYKQLGIKKGTDFLYKIRDWGVPTKEDIKESQNSPTCLSIELKCREMPVTKEMWEPFEQYTQSMFFGNEEALMQMLETNSFYENVIEIGLFIEMICGVDNQYKNQYIASVETDEGYLFQKIPWDFDLTWGNDFDIDSRLLRKFSVENADKIVQDEDFEKLLQTGRYQKKVQQRWKQLRADVYTEENIVGKIDSYHWLLVKSGAYEREKNRWPDAEVSSDVEGIKQFLSARLIVLDDRYTGEEKENYEIP